MSLLALPAEGKDGSACVRRLLACSLSGPRFFSGRYLPGVRPVLLAAPAARSGLVELVDSFRKQRGVGRSSQGRPVSWSLWCFLLPFCSAPFKDSRFPGVLLVSSPHLVSLLRLRFHSIRLFMFSLLLIISPFCSFPMRTIELSELCFSVERKKRDICLVKFKLSR